jgi:hypothetical protein
MIIEMIGLCFWIYGYLCHGGSLWIRIAESIGLYKVSLLLYCYQCLVDYVIALKDSTNHSTEMNKSVEIVMAPISFRSETTQGSELGII